MAAIDSGPVERLHALDAVRGGALLLGVAFHASMSFLPGPQIWVTRDASDPLLGGFFLVAHLFRMTLFFLIAGFFGRLLLERRGAAGFVRNRALRIALPLVTFWPLIIAGSLAAFIWGAVAMSGGAAAPAAPPPPPPTLATFPLTHLWFLYVLLLFYAVALTLRGIGRLVDRQGRIGTRLLDPAMRMLIGIGAAGLALAVPGFLGLQALPVWVPAGGIPTPDFGLIPNSTALAAYGAAFGFGWLLHRQPDLLAGIARHWATHLAVAVLLSGWLAWTFSGAQLFVPVEPARKTLVAGIYMLASWAWTLGLLGAALRFLHAERLALRYVADASYWIYLIHLPVVMLLQVAAFPLAIPALLKFALVLAGASLILFGSYHLLVRHSWLGRWLNGRRIPWRTPAPVLEARPA